MTDRFEMYKTDSIRFIILSLLTAGMSFEACRHKPTIQEMGIRLDTIEVEHSAPLLPDSAVTPQCHLSLSLITIANEELKSINDSLIRCGILSPEYLSLTDMSLSPQVAVDSFVARYVSDYQTFYAGIYNEEQDDNTAQLSLKMTTSIKEGTDSTLVYQAHITNSQGDVCIDYNKYVNINLHSLKLLTLDDIFVHGYERALCEAIGSKLLKQTGFKDMAQLHQGGYFSNIPIYATNNFIFEDKSITFVYVMGEIADRDKGEIQVEVNLSDIKTLLRK